MASAGTPDDRIGELFALPNEEFVAARDALAKECKAAGDKDAAAAVKQLRRPTVAAAAVNWLARDAKKDLAALMKLGDRLREAHDDLAGGGDGADIRKATADRRRRTAALTDRAVAHLGAAGEAQRVAITNTLDAAVSDPDAAERVIAGRLSKELDPPSGLGAGLVFAASPRPEPSTRPAREDRRAARRARRVPTPEVDPAPEVEVEVDTAPLVELRASLQREADTAARVAQEAAREASSARADVASRQSELREAEARLHAAEERARLTQWKSVAAQNDVRHAGE